MDLAHCIKQTLKDMEAMKIINKHQLDPQNLHPAKINVYTCDGIMLDAIPRHEAAQLLKDKLYYAITSEDIIQLPTSALIKVLDGENKPEYFIV